MHGDFDDIRRYTKAGIAAGEKLVFFLIKIEIIKTSKKIENDEKVGDSDSGHASWFALESKPLYTIVKSLRDASFDNEFR